MARLLQPAEFNMLLATLAQTCELRGPVRLAGRGRFSDTDLLKYGSITTVGDIVWDEKTYLSPKEIVFPVTETLLSFTDNGPSTPAAQERDILLFCRACDINAIHRLDNIFLHNGKTPDFYYERLRKRLKFVLLECAEPFESCFCVAMQANRTDDYGAVVRQYDNGILIDTRDALLSEMVGNKGIGADFKVQFPERNGSDVAPPQIIDVPAELFTDALWDEYSKRCIACGRCTTSCPTCSCFSVFDSATDGTTATRKRVWDGCHLDGFTDMAGGMKFRKENGQRMRFKTLHKIFDYRKRFGVNMCVGCGRCDDVCPEYISFANCINRVSGHLAAGGTV